MIDSPQEEKARILDVLWNDSITGLAKVSRDGKFLDANPTFCRMLEYTLDELKLRSFQEITHPADVRADVSSSGLVAQGKLRVHDMKKRYITKTMRVIWVALRVLAVKNDDGSFQFFLAQVSPILELSPPNSDNIASYPAIKPKLSTILLEHLKQYWTVYTALIGAITILLAETIKALKK